VQARFSSIRAAPPAPSLAPQIPTYPTADPGLGPPTFYRQIRPAFVSQVIKLIFDFSLMMLYY